MRIIVDTEYLGYDENNKPIVNWNNSGKYVLGIYASVTVTCVCVVKVFSEKVRWHITEEFLTRELDVDLCVDKIAQFINNYQIEHVFGNQIGTSICHITDYHSIQDNELLKGYEVIELEHEHMIFLARGNLKKITIDEEIKDVWNQEFFKDFTIEDLINKVQYPRMFALSSVLKGALPENWYLANPEVPNVIINSKTGEKTKRKNSYY